MLRLKQNKTKQKRKQSVISSSTFMVSLVPNCPDYFGQGLCLPSRGARPGFLHTVSSWGEDAGTSKGSCEEGRLSRRWRPLPWPQLGAPPSVMCDRTFQLLAPRCPHRLVSLATLPPTLVLAGLPAPGGMETFLAALFCCCFRPRLPPTNIFEHLLFVPLCRALGCPPDLSSRSPVRLPVWCWRWTGGSAACWAQGGQAVWELRCGFPVGPMVAVVPAALGCCDK